MTAVEKLQKWFHTLSEEEQESVLDFVYADDVVRYGRYCGPAPQPGRRTGGLHTGPAPSPRMMTERCPTCGKPM